MFRPLSREDIKHITDIQLKQLSQLLEKQNIEFDYTPAAMDWLAKEGFHQEFGARPLKRVIQRKVLNKLADYLLLNESPEGSKITLDVEEGKIVFRTQVNAPPKVEFSEN